MVTDTVLNQSSDGPDTQKGSLEIYVSFFVGKRHQIKTLMCVLSLPQNSREIPVPESLS